MSITGAITHQMKAKQYKTAFTLLAFQKMRYLMSDSIPDELSSLWTMNCIIIDFTTILDHFILAIYIVLLCAYMTCWQYEISILYFPQVFTISQENEGKAIVFYSKPDNESRANAAFLISAYVVRLSKTQYKAMSKLRSRYYCKIGRHIWRLRL